MNLFEIISRKKSLKISIFPLHESSFFFVQTYDKIRIPISTYSNKKC